jgi:peptide/nickel transport system ATP-binding protein
LDVTVQAQIFDLLNDLKDRTGTAIILITHDMGAIAEMAQRVVVMYAGRVVEQADVTQILTDPRHPYTQGLIRCVPHLTQTPSLERQPLLEIPGVVPPLTQLGSGCPFAPRCEYADGQCRGEMPPSRAIDDGHAVACWRSEREAAA